MVLAAFGAAFDAFEHSPHFCHVWHCLDSFLLASARVQVFGLRFMNGMNSRLASELRSVLA